MSESFRYFFRRLEEGENLEKGDSITLELKMLNSETNEETILISSNPNDDIDNEFQEEL